MPRRHLCLFLLAFGFTAAAGREFIAVGRVSAPPAVDGSLEETSWRDAVEITNFLSLRQPGAAARRKTSVRVVYDRENLHVAFRCHEPLLHPALNRLHEFKAECTVPDDAGRLWKDDIIEIFLEPDPGHGDRYYHIAANSRGVVYDTIRMGEPSCWNSGARCAGRTWHTGGTSAGWDLEISVPFTALGVPAPRAGTRWRVNFCREARSIRETSSWSRVGGSGFHDPATFGDLEFREAVPRVVDISDLSALRTGENSFSLLSPALVLPVLEAEFDTGDRVSLLPRTAGRGRLNCAFTLSSENLCYRFTADPSARTAETFLRTNPFRTVPGRCYTITARTRTNYRLDGSGCRFLHLRQTGAGYQPLGTAFPEDTAGSWTTLRGEFINKEDTQAELWGIKWDSGLTGTIWLDDISVIDNETGQELIPNGTFAAKGAGWDVFRGNDLVRGFGWGAESVAIRYAFREPNGSPLYRSPEFILRLERDFSAIRSSTVFFGREGLIPVRRIRLAAGAPERLNLLLSSDRRDSIDSVRVELLIPPETRLLPPPARTLSPVFRTIREDSEECGGRKYRRYRMECGSGLVNRLDIPDSLAGLVPLFLLADTPVRGPLAPALFRAWIDGGEKEPDWHRLSLEVLEPPVGLRPSSRLPAMMWVYPDTAETDSFTQEQHELFARKIADSGFNLVRCKASRTQDFHRLGVRSFALLPPLTLAGRHHFPGTADFIERHPGLAGMNAQGERRIALDPAVLQAADNPFRPQIEAVIRRMLEVYPHELHIDYEFPFMPAPGKKLPARYGSANIGYSERNLGLFRRKFRTGEGLAPESILAKHAEAWRDFRNGQIADSMRVVAEIARRISPGVRLSLYSGYPPQAEKYYGIDWRKAAPMVDLVCAGYGGDDARLLRCIPQPFFTSGLLLMHQVDGREIANRIAGRLANSGSYLAYVHYTVDGGFFRGASVAAAIAADFESMFLDYRNTVDRTATVDARTGRTVRGLRTFTTDFHVI